jgi:hypothetical protein
MQRVTKIMTVTCDIVQKIGEIADILSGEFTRAGKNEPVEVRNRLWRQVRLITKKLSHGSPRGYVKQ